MELSGVFGVGADTIESDDTFETISALIRECTTRHHYCKQWPALAHASTTRLPTRLLEINESSADSQ